MKHAKDPLQARFGKAIGQTLRKIVASIHVFDTAALGCDVPLCLWLFFDTLPGVRLSGAADGWSIQADDTPPEPIDLEESGEIILRDVSRTSVFQRALGRALQAAWSVQSFPTGEVIGIRFDFGQSITPCVLNWGDELYIAEQYPADAQKNELREVLIMPG
jgi:hypothetical protein